LRFLAIPTISFQPKLLFSKGRGHPYLASSWCISKLILDKRRRARAIIFSPRSQIHSSFNIRARARALGTSARRYRLPVRTRRSTTGSEGKCPRTVHQATHRGGGREVWVKKGESDFQTFESRVFIENCLWSQGCRMFRLNTHWIIDGAKILASPRSRRDSCSWGHGIQFGVTRSHSISYICHVWILCRIEF